MQILDSKGVGERGRNRTFNLLIKSQLLCQLSYAPEQEKRRNLRQIQCNTALRGTARLGSVAQRWCRASK